MPINLANMVKARYRCPNCGFTTDAEYWMYRCPRCGAPLDLEYEPRKPRSLTRGELSRVLPVKEPLSLGEGLTPLVKRGEYYFKLEYVNPTGSFKDRGWSAALAPFDRGIVVVEDSSGNAGLSLAAYSAFWGFRARIYVPSTAPEWKKNAIRLLGATVIEAPTRADAASLAMSYSEGTYVGHSWNPIFIHGVKLIAYEIALELGEVDYVVAPLGNGTLMLGLYQGFREAVELGIIKDMPSLIGVEASGYEWAYSRLYGAPRGVQARLPDGIAVPEPPRLSEIIKAIKETGGEVLVASDSDVVEGLKEAYRLGFLIEPTSAVVFKARDVVKGRPVFILTGSGLKSIRDVYGLVRGLDNS